MTEHALVLQYRPRDQGNERQRMELGSCRSTMSVSPHIHTAALSLTTLRYDDTTAQDLSFQTTSRTAFTIPISLVHNTSITKQEVALEFSSSIPPAPKDEDPIARKRRLRLLPDEVSEIRFYVPGTAKGAKKRAEKKEKVVVKGEDGQPIKVDSEDESESEDDGDDPAGGSAAQVFHDSIKEKAEVGLVVGEVLCTIPEILCATPRGRFGSFCLSLHFSL